MQNIKNDDISPPSQSFFITTLLSPVSEKTWMFGSKLLSGRLAAIHGDLEVIKTTVFPIDSAKLNHF